MSYSVTICLRFLTNLINITLPPDLFKHNPLLIQVEIDGSELMSLPEGLFRFNPLLQQVSLQKNQLTPAGIPNSLFDYTRENTMFIFLGNNPLVYMREEIFFGLSRPTVGTISM